jgi:hypothetical protein
MKYKKGASVLPGYHPGIGLFLFLVVVYTRFVLRNLMVIPLLKKEDPVFGYLSG